MEADKDILKQIGRKDGMTVPDGFFADFAARMADSLPVTPYEQSAVAPAPKPSLWHRVRPYAYMAAMFAGVWCMLKMFTMITSDPTANAAQSPALAEAMGNDIFVKDYIIDNINEYELYDQLYDDGVEIDDIYETIDIDIQQ